MIYDLSGNISSPIGDTLLMQVDVYDLADAPVDLDTVTTITYVISQCYTEDEVLTQELGDGTIYVLPYDVNTNPDNNKYVIEVPAASTALLKGVYSHKSVLTDSTGRVGTVFRSNSLNFD
jgi:flavoprotein